MISTQLCLLVIFTALKYVFTSSEFQFIYGQHFPNGASAVNYIYSETHGTWKQIKELQYIWNYYEQYETPNHPYNKSALIGAANGINNTFTARDANGYLLCDSNDNLEIDNDEIDCGWGFHEHNGRGVNNSVRGGPFTQFWLDDNWLARYMSIAYDRPHPSGLVDHPGSFMRWKAIAGDVVENGWAPYNWDYLDTLALDGLYYIAQGDYDQAVSSWRASLIKSKAVWNEQRQVFDYPEVHENYHLGLWKILTEQLIGFSIYLDSTLIDLLTQHSVSQRVHILDYQEKDSKGESTGWISNIGQTSSLINTESVSVNTLALGAHSKYVFEVTDSPMMIGDGNYYVRSSYILSAIVGVSSKGLMSYGPNITLPRGPFTVQFCVRSSLPVDKIARVEVYDSTEAKTLEIYNITASDFTGGSNSWSLIPVKFLSSEANHTYEFRTHWNGLSSMDIALIKIL